MYIGFLNFYHNSHDIIITILVLGSRPSLQQLTNLVVPHYAAKWRVIGVLLGLSQSTLDIIKYNHGRDAINYCIEMCGKWLDTDTSATWRKVLDVLEHKAVTVTEAKISN